MTSRTTKQAARAYQKAHGVPYAEALRVVMGGTHPRQADEETWLQHAEETRADPDQTFRFQLLDPLGDQEDVDRDEEMPHENVTGRPAAGKQRAYAAPSPRPLWFALGSSEIDYGFTLNGAPGQLPVDWAPGIALEEGRPPALGVYGPDGVGKTVFLATLADEVADRAPVLVVTSHPRRYPAPRRGLQFFLPDDPDARPVAADVDPAQVIATARDLAAEHPSGEMPVVIFDMDEGEPALHDPLTWLLQQCRSQEIVVLFAKTYNRGGDDGGLTSRLLPADLRHATVVLSDRADQRPAWPTMPAMFTPESYPSNWAQVQGRTPIPLLTWLDDEEVIFLGR